jgi:ubiquinone/menaquinone biosynthesis C-methylase UbiE
MPATRVYTVPPFKISALMQSDWANRALKAAVELDVFSALKGQDLTAAALAKKLSLNERATGLLLDAMVSLEFLQKSQNTYKLSDLAAIYLCKDSDLYMGKHIASKQLMDECWAGLTEVVRTGEPRARINDKAQGEAFFKDLTEAIFPLNYATAQMLADELKVSGMSGEPRVLDLAAGSAVWSLPMAQANKSLKVDALDFPGVLDVTGKFAEKFGVADRYEYLSGNWRDVKLADEAYDVILLGHILHSEGKELSEQLLKYCAAALKKGGTLVVAEFMENEERSGPMFATLFAINMMVSTAKGCVFTVEELKKMLEQAGLRDPKRLSLPFWEAQSPLIMAQK